MLFRTQRYYNNILFSVAVVLTGEGPRDDQPTAQHVLIE